MQNITDTDMPRKLFLYTIRAIKPILLNVLRNEDKSTENLFLVCTEEV
jgi:hypothetical protein